MIEYDEAPTRPFHFRVAIASWGGVFSDGFGLGIIGIALSHAAPQLTLGSLWMGLLGGASLLGLFAGALLTGPAADHFGRRPIFAYNMVLLSALSVLQSVVDSAAHLLVLRLAIGFLLGTDYVVSKALLTEFVPRRLRGRVLGLLSIAWAGGYACAYVVGFALGRSGPHAWRWMLLASAVPCLVVLPMRLTMPESPCWLTSRGRLGEAAAVVRGIFGDAVAPPANLPAAPARHGRWRQLLARRWRRRTAVACVFFTCQVIPYFALGTFVSQVISAMHFGNGDVGGLFYNLSLLLGAVVGLLVIDRLSRRAFLIGSFSVTATSLLVLSVCPHLPPWAMTLLFAIFAGVLSAASNLVYVYLPELFPTDLRASGIGLAIASSRIASACGTFLLPVIVGSYGVRTALNACVAVLGIGALVCYRWAPETRHLPLSALDAVLPGTPEEHFTSSITI
ncbi:MAG TPA: MFS transporter [Steroidobacteraceae bacterium]|jgi:putative MFS transporter|nr:MFS transporter [Steroidobacteraceae bacterium]